MVEAAASLLATALSTARSEHMRQVSDRLDFLTFATVHGQLRLSTAQMDVLWDCCVCRASSAEEADMLFGWLETVRLKATDGVHGRSWRCISLAALARWCGR